MSQDVTRSWFAILNNPADHGFPGSPQEVCERLRDEWIGDSTTRSGAWAYCISARGLHHVHMVLEDSIAMRFSVVKRTYAVGVHLEPTKGSKKQAEDYIYKRHPFEEKDEEVVCIVTAGTIVGAPGKRTDLEMIAALLDDGKNPQEIMEMNFAFRRFEREIRNAYFRQRWRDTPPIRNVCVHLLVGESGSGKTHRYAELCEEHGEDNVCLITDHSINGGFDHYAGERIIFIDEFKGQYPYSMFLMLTDRYKAQVHARYANVWAMWYEVYITSIYPPEALYELMVPLERRAADSREQMYRRITDVTYCFKNEDGEYNRYTVSMADYCSYEQLKVDAVFRVPPLFA